MAKEAAAKKLVASGYIDNHDDLGALLQGCDDYLTKQAIDRRFGRGSGKTATPDVELTGADDIGGEKLELADDKKEDTKTPSFSSRATDWLQSAGTRMNGTYNDFKDATGGGYGSLLTAGLGGTALASGLSAALGSPRKSKRRAIIAALAAAGALASGVYGDKINSFVGDHIGAAGGWLSSLKAGLGGAVDDVRAGWAGTPEQPKPYVGTGKWEGLNLKMPEGVELPVDKP